MQPHQSIGLSMVIAIIAHVAPARAESHPIWDPTLENTALGSGENVPATVFELAERVAPWAAMDVASIRAEVNTQTANVNDHNALMVRVTYNLALLSHLNDDDEAALSAAILLDRFAEVFPSWVLEYCHGQCGIWTGWYHDDLGGVARHLAEAFDLLAPSGVFDLIDADAEDRARELLVEIVRADMGFRIYTFNWAFSRPLGFVIFGRVLDDPELVHLGFWYYAKQVHEYYTRDGYMQEGSYSYHHQMTNRTISWRYPFYLNGYSDPLGYEHDLFDHRWDAARIDDFDFDALYADSWERMRSSCYDTALPNGQWPVTNETKHYGYVVGGSVPPEASTLLGGIGHAILAGGEAETQTQARLDFSFAVNHSHHDALHLIYFGDGFETVGGTAYRYPIREWNESTLAQNLVVIDLAEQRSGYFVDWTDSPYVPGESRGEVQRGLVPEGTNVHNDVVLWWPGSDAFLEVQVIEVDAVDAYRDTATRYQRTLALVHLDGDDYYLLDLFRVRGGTQHDWTLHGGHELHTMATDLVLDAVDVPFGEVTLQGSAATDGQWSAAFDYGDVTGRVLMAGRDGTTVHVGRGPRFEHGGEQDYLIVRRLASPDVEDRFVAVHESHSGEPGVVSIEELALDDDTGDTMAIKVELANGDVDYVIHTMSGAAEGGVISVSDVPMSAQGRFSHVRTSPTGEPRWLVSLDGAFLSFGDREIEPPTSESFSHSGEVVAVERRESGHPDNAFIVDMMLPNDGRLDGQTLLITWGNGWTWAYVIDEVVGERIITTNEPGFELDAEGIDSQYSLIQEFFGLDRYPDPITFRVQGAAYLEEGGELHHTDFDPGASDGDADGDTDADGDADGDADADGDGDVDADGDGDGDVANGETDDGCGCDTAGAPATVRGVGRWLLVP